MLTFSRFKWSKRRKVTLFILCLINWRAEFDKGKEKSPQHNPHHFWLSKETACGPLSTTSTQTLQTSSFRIICLCSKSHEKKVSFKLPLRKVKEQEKLHCVIPTWQAWGNMDAQKPPGQEEGGEQPRPALCTSWGILGEEADGREDIPPISEGEGLLLHLLIEGLKTDFTESTCASGLTEASAV